MKQPKLPPTLTREDFDTEDEYQYYLSSESDEFEPIPENIDEVRDKWKKSKPFTQKDK